tara:strand:- start:61 stop:429 length:369 start_codon:yes stop_codon:yes gene_type:complete
MTHFAEVKDGIVQRVIVAEQDFIDSGAVGDSSNWVQTSYNTRGGVHYAPNSDTPDGGTALRKNYASVGSVYDSGRDAFYDPQPFPSWTLNEIGFFWESPIPYPDGAEVAVWNEDAQSWDILE